MSWRVVYTDVAAEPIAVRELEAQGIGTFLPHYCVGRWRGSQLKVRAQPLLPRYVFVNLPGNGAWGPIAAAKGVQRILKAGDAPAKVSDSDVANLMLAHARGFYDRTEPSRDGAGTGSADAGRGMERLLAVHPPDLFSADGFRRKDSTPGARVS